jgi:hypothetical protein
MLIKCFEWSTLRHFSSECPNKKIIKQNSLEDKETYLRECALPIKKNAII